MAKPQKKETPIEIEQTASLSFINWLDGVGTVDVDALYTAALPDGKTLENFYDAAEFVDAVRGDAAAIVIGESLAQEGIVSVAPWLAGGTTTGALTSTAEGMWCQYTTEATSALESALQDIVGRYGTCGSDGDDDSELM